MYVMNPNRKKTHQMANAFNIALIRGYIPQGASADYSNHLYRFQSVRYCIRCLFALFRRWSQTEGSLTISVIARKKTGLDGTALADYIYNLAWRSNVPEGEILDYHSVRIRNVVKAMAKIETNWDLKDEDIIYAQMLVL